MLLLPNEKYTKVMTKDPQPTTIIYPVHILYFFKLAQLICIDNFCWHFLSQVVNMIYEDQLGYVCVLQVMAS